MGKTYCIFSAQYLPHLGGVERYTYNLAKYLTQKGDKVVVVTSNGDNLSAYEEMDHVKVFRLPCWSLMDGRYPVLKLNRQYLKIHRRLKRINFDLVLVNTRFYPHSLYGAFFAWLRKTKCVMVEHGTGHMTLHNPAANAAEQLVEHTITKIDRIFCKDFYGVSKACMDWLGHFHIKAKGTLYNAVDMEKIERIQKSRLRDFKKEYHIPQDGLIITFTGRLLKEKGILKLTEAVQNIRKMNENVFLFIAGDGDEEKTIQSLAGTGILPVGKLDFEDVIALLTQTDIFCLPSDYPEGFSTSVLEAAACRCFVMTTDRGGSKELIKGKEYGMIIRNNDVAGIQNALEQVISQDAYRVAAVQNAYQRLIENFTWDITSEKVRNL